MCDLTDDEIMERAAVIMERKGEQIADWIDQLNEVSIEDDNNVENKLALLWLAHSQIETTNIIIAYFAGFWGPEHDIAIAKPKKKAKKRKQ